MRLLLIEQLAGVILVRAVPLRDSASRRTAAPELAPSDELLGAAREARLRYASDAEPGLRRVRSGKGFTYRNPDGQPVKDPSMLRRIKALAIPPAWTDVWICPDPEGHLQATGRDQRRRKQHRYHPRWREVRDEAKYSRTLAFGKALPAIRARIKIALAAPGLSRDKVLATLVQLLESTLIRIGNEEYARANASFGLTTLRDRHVRIAGATLTFAFRGKSGVVQQVSLTDRRLARIVKSCQDVPGQVLFQYIDAAGERQTVESADVNAYLRDIAGDDFSAKDFRTWSGTVLAMKALSGTEPPASKAAARRNIAAAVRAVAARLGNTPTVCRKCYIHPAVIESYGEGALHAPTKEGNRQRRVRGLTPEECRLVALLEAHESRRSKRSPDKLALGLEQALRRSLRPARRNDAGGRP